MIRLALFDVDGTLLDSGGAGRRALLGAAREILGRSLGEGVGRVEFAGRTDPAILRSMLACAGIAEAPEDLGRRIFERYLVLLREDIARPGVGGLHRGVQTLLTRLVEDPEFRIGIVTGNIEEGARIKLSRYGILSFFRFGGYGSDAEDRDHLVGIARGRASALEGRDLSSAPAVVIGDTPHDIRCARAGNARALAVSSGFAPPASLEAERPDALLEDLADSGRVLRLLRELTGSSLPAARAIPRKDP